LGVCYYPEQWYVGGEERVRSILNESFYHLVVTMKAQSYSKRSNRVFTLFVSDRPESTWESDFARMKDLGLTYVRMFEFSWYKMEPQEGKFNWEWIDKVLDLCTKNGLKVIMGFVISLVVPESVIITNECSIRDLI
jgi:GH35 family endo-1,4-beta-xylanase